MLLMRRDSLYLVQPYGGIGPTYAIPKVPFVWYSLISYALLGLAVAICGIGIFVPGLFTGLAFTSRYQLIALMVLTLFSLCVRGLVAMICKTSGLAEGVEGRADVLLLLFGVHSTAVRRILYSIAALLFSLSSILLLLVIAIAFQRHQFVSLRVFVFCSLCIYAAWAFWVARASATRRS